MTADTLKDLCLCGETTRVQFKEGMAFLKSYLRHEQRGQKFNSTGILEISEVALEELIETRKGRYSDRPYLKNIM